MSDKDLHQMLVRLVPKRKKGVLAAIFENKNATYVRDQIVRSWVTLLDFAGGTDENRDLLRLNEDLLPEQAPDIDVFVNGEARKAKDSKEAFASLMEGVLDPEEAIKLYLTFAENVRKLLSRCGEIRLLKNIVVCRGTKRYFAYFPPP